MALTRKDIRDILSLHLDEFARRSGSEPLRGRARERYLDEFEEALMERARESQDEEEV